MLRSLWSFLKRHKKKCLVLGTFLGGECAAAALRGGHRGRRGASPFPLKRSRFPQDRPPQRRR